MTNQTPRRRRRRANPETNVAVPASTTSRQEKVTPPIVSEGSFSRGYEGKHRAADPVDTAPASDTFAPIPTSEPATDKTSGPTETRDPIGDKKSPLSREGKVIKPDQPSKHRKKSSNNEVLEWIQSNWWILIGALILIIGTVLVFKEFGAIAAVCVILFTAALFFIEEWFARRNTSSETENEFDL